MNFYFNFNFFGWIYSIQEGFQTKNGIDYKKIRVVNGNQFNVFIVFANQENYKNLQPKDLIKIDGSLKKNSDGGCIFNIINLKILNPKAAQVQEPSANQDFDEVYENEFKKKK